MKFIKGQKPWNYDRIQVICKSCKIQFSVSPSRVKKKGNFCSTDCSNNFNSVKGKGNYNWKGDDVGYSGIHVWIREKFGNAKTCENKLREILKFPCSKTSQIFQWAMIHEKGYKRKRENFMMLCVSCHSKYERPPSKIREFEETLKIKRSKEETIPT